MRLKLRYYRSEGTIRSIGDPPNGILTFDCRHGRATWVVDPTMEPGSSRLGGPLRPREQRGVLIDDRPANLIDVDVPSVLDGCDNDLTRRTLIRAIALAVASCAQLLNESPAFIDDLEGIVALARETIDGARARGWA